MIRSTLRATTHLHTCSPGKTTFVKFMLAKLISAGQVVLFYHPPKVYLFYHGRVYPRLAAYGFEVLPEHRTAYYPIWALIDGDCPKGRGPAMSSNPFAWPVQATSPDPSRWESWSRKNGATLLGMPLWNVEELVETVCFSPFLSSIPVTLFNGGLLLTVLHLCCSLRLHPEYNDFRSRLGKLLRPPDASTTPITGEGPMGAALEVLRKAVRSQALMDNVEDALEILVHNATEEFGFIPS